MNCAESQDLLLDLAYGELPPARTAEVEAHVLGCAACRAEMAQLEDARKAAAPLRELEEPPAGFDEPILRAARAEAGLQADGTPGPVVEVSATVKPLGLHAARLDPHARTRGATARPARWGRRAAVFGSIAAAAGLAVVVTSSLTTRPAARMAEEVAPIQVRAPGTVPISVDDALGALGKAAAPEESRARSRETGAPPPARALDAAKLKVANAPEPAKERTSRREQQAPAAAEKPPAAAQKAAPAAQEADQLVVPIEEHFQASQKAVGRPSREGDQLEDQASAARLRGDYARAAALYRDASALRRQSDPARAAWDMAHVVECLAAGGQVREAVAARKELVRAFPDHSGPKAAADSALRSFRLPAEDQNPR